MKVTHLVMGCEPANRLGLDPMQHGDPDCTVILIEQDGVVTSISHASADLEPVERFNRTYPDGEDWRDLEHHLEPEATEDGLVIGRTRKPKMLRGTHPE